MRKKIATRLPKNSPEALLKGLDILIADGNAYMRRLTRLMLINLGARSVLEATDGPAALEAITTGIPQVMLLDWDIPVISGIEVVRTVRSPRVFPRPHIPIIMLSNHADEAAVKEAMRAGVHEFLLKPTSPKALRDRLTMILVKPRPMMQNGDFYGPEPRPRLDQARIKPKPQAKPQRSIVAI